tara:strand:+ start:384 stop:1403 length:1020 start_codon:yes stop_codon:yes gene_type:complete
MENLNNFFSKYLLKLQKKINNGSQEMRYKSSNFWGITLTWSIIGFFSLGFLYACIARIDEVVITRGELQALGAQRPIKMPFSGVINEILIKEGDQVQKDQLLIKIDTDIFESRKQKLVAEINGLKEILANERDILDRISKILEVGASSRVEYIQQKIKVEELISREKQIKEELQEVEYQLKQTGLRSPLVGKIFNLIPSSTGYVASAGETLLEIVPEGPMEAKVFFNNSDVGFLRPEMEAEIRLDAYPFTQFGSIEGNLKSVGEESLPPDQFNNQVRFPGYVSLDKQYLEKNQKKYFVKSGQTVAVNFIVRDKPLITLLTDVIANSWDNLRGIKTERSR